jgi:transposase-like protein
MEDWQEILQKIEQSGLSIAQYCRENDIKPHTVRYWKQKLVKQDTLGFVRISTGIPYPHKQAHLYQSLDLPELCC